MRVFDSRVCSSHGVCKVEDIVTVFARLPRRAADLSGNLLQVIVVASEGWIVAGGYVDQYIPGPHRLVVFVQQMKFDSQSLVAVFFSVVKMVQYRLTVLVLDLVAHAIDAAR